jgi:hypothetical protein
MRAMRKTALRSAGTSAPSTINVAESIKLIRDKKWPLRLRLHGRTGFGATSFVTHFQTMLPDDGAGVHLKSAHPVRGELTQIKRHPGSRTEGRQTGSLTHGKKTPAIGMK